MVEFLSLDLTFVFALLFIGIFSGMIAGIFGIGGGAIIVPMMIFLGNDIKVAIGISIMQMTFSSLYGSYINFKKKNLAFKDGLYVGLGGLIGASFSGLIVLYIPSNILEIIFIFFILYAIFKMFKINADGGERKISEKYEKVFMLICGIFVGIFAISLGIGGGMLIAPLFAYYLGYSSKKIIPISLFFVIFSSLSGFASLALNGLVDYKQGVIVGVASLIGVQIGIWILSKINAKKHKVALLIMYLVVLLIMLEKIFF